MPNSKIVGSDVTVIPVTDKNEKLITNWVRDRISRFPRAEIVQRLEELDKYYHLQTRRDPDDEDFNSRYQDIDIGMVNPNAETDAAFYTDTFLTSVPMFTAVSSEAKSAEAKAVDGKITKDESEFSWKSQFIKAMRNVAKHNKCLVEVDWEGGIPTKAYSGNVTESGAKEISDISYVGNKISSWSLYNSMFDTSVDLSELADEGEYAANVSLISYVKLAELEERLGIEISEELWASGMQAENWNDSQFRTPNIWAEKNPIKKNEIDWLAHGGYVVPSEEADVKNRMKDAKRNYTKHKIYARMIPAMFGISVPKSHRPQIFKMIFINGKLVYIKHLQNFHNRLPVVGAQAIEDDTGLETPGPAQNSAGFQNLNKKMLDRLMAILDRIVSDRALYDPTLIDGESISSAIPDAKIPARPSALTGLGGAYFPIPFNISGMPEIGRMMEMVKGMAEETVSINKAQQGNFVQGNKTLGEWQDVMQGANAKPFMRALTIESTLFAKVKFLIKSNIWQYQEQEEFILNGETEPVKFDPAAVRQNILDIRLSDGLMSASKMLKSGGLEYMLQLLLQVPQIGMKFDAAKVFAYLMMQGKGIDIRQFALTPEQQAQQQQLAIQGPQNPAGATNGQQ